jgi:hypothetical protein
MKSSSLPVQLDQAHLVGNITVPETVRVNNNETHGMKV